MKTLYIECNMGAAGDMLAASLLDLLPKEKQDYVIQKLNSLIPYKVKVIRDRTKKCGIEGCGFRVFVNDIEEQSADEYEGINNQDNYVHDHTHEQSCNHDEHNHNHDEHTHNHDEHTHNHDDHTHHHHHTKVSDIKLIVDKMKLSPQVQNDIIQIYNLIARAESTVHGENIDKIHFHEVGEYDAIFDITAVCLLLSMISPDRIIVSPIRTGFGSVHCQHGILPVPAPATQYLLENIPTYQGNIEGEMCTPTGAAILKYFADDFGQRPVMIVEKTGYGMGKKDFESANCVRAMLGEEQSVNDEKSDKIIKLEANIDDMTAEELGFAMSMLFENGAREVYTSPVFMKKNRLGTLLSVLCLVEDREKIVKSIFKYTTTIGMREIECNRYVLDREIEVSGKTTGEVRIKKSCGYGVVREKSEYDDIERIARETGKSFREVKKLYE